MVCQTGILGGIENINLDTIKNIPNGIYLTGFFSNYPSQKIMNEIFEFIEKNKIDIHIGKIYKFSDIKQAIIDQDKNIIKLKIVIF